MIAADVRTLQGGLGFHGFSLNGLVVVEGLLFVIEGGFLAIGTRNLIPPCRVASRVHRRVHRSVERVRRTRVGSEVGYRLGGHTPLDGIFRAPVAAGHDALRRFQMDLTAAVSVRIHRKTVRVRGLGGLDLIPRVPLRRLTGPLSGLTRLVSRLWTLLSSLLGVLQLEVRLPGDAHLDVATHTTELVFEARVLPHLRDRTADPHHVRDRA